MAENQNHQGIAQPVDFLTAGAGMAETGPVVVLSIRPDQDSWRPHNLSLSPKDFERLRRSLNEMAQTSEFLAEELPRIQDELDAQEEVL